MKSLSDFNSYSPFLLLSIPRSGLSFNRPRNPMHSEASIPIENTSLVGTCCGQEVPCRNGGGSAPSSSSNCARSSRESAAHFHTARAPGSRGGTAPCVKPSPAHPARPSPPTQNPPPTRSIWDGSPAATGTSPCPSSSAPKCRASSPALRAPRGTLPSTHQTPVPV